MEDTAICRCHERRRRQENPDWKMTHDEIYDKINLKVFFSTAQVMGSIHLFVAVMSTSTVKKIQLGK